jgi:hypothetical protein
MTNDPGGLVAAAINALQNLPARERVVSAAAFIAAVQGPDDRRIARIRWAAIAEMHEAGVSVAEIADQIGVSAGAVELAIQAHRRGSSTPA